MAQTQIITCRNCGEQLAKLNTETGEIFDITLKPIEGETLIEVMQLPSFNLRDKKSVTCGYCGTDNGIY